MAHDIATGRSGRGARWLALTVIATLSVGCGIGIGDRGPVLSAPATEQPEPTAVATGATASAGSSPAPASPGGTALISPSAGGAGTTARPPAPRGTASPVPGRTGTGTGATPSGGVSPPSPAPTAGGPGQSPPTAPPRTAPPEPSDPGTLTVAAYFLSDDGAGAGPRLVPAARTIERTRAVGAAAMRELLTGPSTVERAARPPLTTEIPRETLFLGLSISGGVATVDLSREFEAGGGTASLSRRLAQVVYTLTQFRTATSVRFRLDGENVSVFSGDGTRLERPVTRDDYLSLLPDVFVDAPAWGGVLRNPARVTGRANVFEATFTLDLSSGGRLLGRWTVTATCGSGCWGDFDVTVPYSVSAAGPGTLTVLTLSAADGSRQDVRHYPVTLTPTG